MSRYKTAKERRRRRAERKAAERAQRKPAGVEIISQTKQQIGGVTVTFTVGRINPSKDRDNG